MRMNVKAPARKPKAAAQIKKCNCKNSKCLKLYCECFASGRYCDNCNCVNCFNNSENEAVRQQAVEGILERNPNAFRPKIQTADGEATRMSDGVRHCKGCNCKKSGCLKKYCECFQGGIFCSEICRCLDCKNYDGSEARAHVVRGMGLGAGSGAPPGLKRQRVHAPAAAGSAGSGGAPSPAGLPPAGALPLLLPGGAGQLPLLPLHAGGGVGGLPPLPMQGFPGLPGLPGLFLSQVVQSQQLAAAEQPVPRAAAYAAVHSALRDEVVEGVGRLLLIVAQEEGDRAAADEGAAPGAAAAEGATEEGADAQGAGGAAAGEAEAEAEAEGGDPEADRRRREQKELLAALAAAHAAVQAEAGAPAAQQQQQQGEGEEEGGGPLGLTARYAAQEAAVLGEFEATLRSVLAVARKKGSALQQQDGAQGRAAAAGGGGGGGGAAGCNGAADGARLPPLSLPSPHAGTPGPLGALPGCSASPASGVSMQQAVALQAAAAAAAAPHPVLGGLS